MITRPQRILAVLGLVLICLSLVLMLLGLFCGAARELLLNIALCCFLGAVTVLLIVRAQREREEKKDSEGEQ
ncbi:MAG: hypothetical protein PUC00_12030 [Clostridiales bacterium]|nr:hypothetical protein [Clostridiales bacterium]